MCDCLGVLPGSSATGTALFAKNSDRPPTEPQDLEWHPARVDADRVRTTYIDIEGAGETLGVLGSRPRWMWGFEHGVNEAGLAVGNEAVYTTLDPRAFAPALVGMDLVRLALERADTAGRGVEVIAELLARHGQGGGGHDGGARPYWSSFLLVDPSEAFVVETSGTDLAVEQVEGHRAISNRTTIDWFDEAHGVRSPALEAMVDPRLAASAAALDADPATVEGMKAHLRSHAGGEDGWTICMHAGTEATTAAMVVALPPTGTRVAHVAMGSPCTSLFVPIVVGEPMRAAPAWEEFAGLDETGVDERRALETTLAAEVATGVGWNDAVWHRVAEVVGVG